MSSKNSVKRWTIKLSSASKKLDAREEIDQKQIIKVRIYGLKAELVKVKEGTQVALCCENSLTEEVHASIAVVDDCRNWGTNQDVSVDLPLCNPDFTRPILLTLSLKAVVDPDKPKTWKLLGKSTVDISHCTYEAVWGPSLFTLILDDAQQQQQHCSDLGVGTLHCIMRSEHFGTSSTHDEDNDDCDTIKALRTDSPLQRALSSFSKLSTRFSSSPAASIKEGGTISTSAASTPQHASIVGTPKHQVYSIYAEDSQTNTISPDQFDNIHLRNDSPATLRRRCAVLMAERDDLRLWQYEHASKEVQKDIELDSLKRSKDVLLERLRNTEYQLLAVYNGGSNMDGGGGGEESSSFIKQLVDAKIASAEAELKILELEGALNKSSMHIVSLEKQLQAKKTRKRW